MTLAEITLSQEQQAAADGLEKFLADFPNTRRKYFVIEGYAGTGKSFTITHIIDKLKLRAQYMAYTGKAALVLRKYAKVDAQTIHSTIYRLVQVSDDVFKNLYKQLEEAPDPEAGHAIELKIKELMEPKFELDPEAFDESRPDILVLDECSMVDAELLQDLLHFGIPIVALGDPGQLPPVHGTGALFSGVADAQLREIRRQALDSPIIEWSMYAREQRTLPMTPVDDVLELDAARVPLGMVKDRMTELYNAHDIMLVWKNKTRKELNQWVRKARGFYAQNPTYPVVGETIQITKNDRALGIFNGMFAEVVDVGNVLDNYIETKVLTEEGDEIDLKLLRAPFDEYNDPDAFKKLRPWDFHGTQQADFGYVITCHKAQGSQWPKVLVYDENVFNWYKGDAQEKRAQWVYTAITRAAEKVTVISS